MDGDVLGPSTCGLDVTCEPRVCSVRQRVGGCSMCLPADGAPAWRWARHRLILEEQEAMLRLRVLRSRLTRPSICG